jgi:hypothetical protein
MHSNPQTPKISDFTLEVAHALLFEASKRPWLASLLLHHTQWLSELAQCLSNLSRHTRRILRRALNAGMAAAVLAATFLWASPARAGTITVDGATCSLANAITTANTGTNTSGCTGGSAGADTINLQTDVTLTTELPQITTDITIEGNGHTIQRNSGAPNFRILHVYGSSGNLTLKKATISGGNVPGSENNNGGGVNIDLGSATIINSTISGNYASQFGGGIFSNNNLTVQNSAITGNSNGSYGAGIFARGSSLTVENSTISGNTADFAMGGGLYAYSITSVSITNSTISGNYAIDGSGFGIEHGTATIENSIIAGQTSGDDCFIGLHGAINSQGYNIESSTSCGFTGTGDQRNVTSGNLNLSSLADNGGPTQTRALGSGSVAIDKIPNGTNGCVAGTSFDQRGAVRAGGDSTHGGTACDIGAYEANSNFTPTAVTIRNFAASPGSIAGYLTAFVAAVTTTGAGILGWRRIKK